MELIKTIWNLVVMALALSCFGGLSKIRYELGMSAVGLHESGGVSLARFNRSLVGK